MTFGLGGGQGIWTLAPFFRRPTPLAGEPLHHLSNPPYGKVINWFNWRRERDSNPWSLAGSLVFKTSSLNHSDISPYVPMYHKNYCIIFMQKCQAKYEIPKKILKSTTSIGISLFSHLVAKALFSAPLSLTSVFGMGTGGPSASSTPTVKLNITTHNGSF